MKLKDQITAFSEMAAKKLPPEFFQKAKNEIDRLVSTKITETALKAGDKAIDFTLTDQNSQQVSLSELLKKGNVIISFSRGTWCPFCNLEYRALQNSLPEIQSKNVTLLNISPELPSIVKEAAEKNGYEFPMLFDKGNAVARNYGLVFTLGDELHDASASLSGHTLLDSNGDNSHELPIPATYVINQEGVIIYAFVNPNWAVRAEPEEYLALLS